jgi:hypothetical protein
MSFYAEAGVNFIGIWKQRADDHLDVQQPFHNSPHRLAPLIETRLFSQAKPCRSAPMSSHLKLAIRRRSVQAGSFSPISNTSFARAAASLIQSTPL